MAQRTEKPLREDLQRQTAQLKELQDNHAKALTSAERSLSGEKASSAELARRFAAKLTEHDRLRAIVEQHAHTIDEVVAIRDDLDQRLRRELATSADLKTKFESTAEALNANRALLLERESALAEEERRQAQLMEQIEALRSSLQAAETSTQDAHREVTVAAKARGDEERRRIELEAQLREIEGERDTIVMERNTAQAQIVALTGERDGLLPIQRDLAARSAELERTLATVAKLREELAGARTEQQASEQLAQERSDEIVAMREKLADSAANVQRLEDDLTAQ